MVLNVFVMEQIHENKIVSYKTASYEGIGEIVNRHRVVVQTKRGVDVELIFFDFLLGSLLGAECSQVESSIVKIWRSKVSSPLILLDLVHLDVTYIIDPAKLLLKRGHKSLEIKLVHIMLTIIFFRNSYGGDRVVSYHTVDDRILSHHVLGPCEARKNIVKVLKPLVRLDVLVRLGSKRHFVLLYLHHLLISEHLLLEFGFLFIQESSALFIQIIIIFLVIRVGRANRFIIVK